jgi:hypothetical protein
LRRLSVFAEGFDLEAAEAVCGLGDIEVFDVTDLLGSLVDKSLVVAEPTGGGVRYRLLETIRQFGAEHLVELDEREAAAVGTAHCAHYLAVAEQVAPHLTGPEQGTWLSRLDADRSNLRRAIEHAAGDPEGTALVLRFGVALRRFWWVRSRLEGAEMLIPVLERPEAQADATLYVGALVTAAFGARFVDIATARRYAERAVEVARRLGEDRPLVEALTILCAVCYFAGDSESGFPLGQEGVALSRPLHDDVVLGESLGMFLLCSKDIDPARTDELFSEAIACTHTSGDHFVTAVLENNAGVNSLQDGDVPAARKHLERAEAAWRDIGSIIHNVAINLGWVLREEGDGDSAGTMFEQGLRTARRNGDRSGLGYANLGLACLAADHGDWHRAAVLHGAAQDFMNQTGEPWVEPEERYRLASLEEVRQHLGPDDFERAIAAGHGLSTKEAVDLAFARIPTA